MKKITTLTYACALGTLIAASSAQAADVTLRFGHFWPAVSAAQKDIFQAWADQVKQDSDGRIKVDIYASSMLAKPPAQYDAVSHQIIDVTATVQGYTANRFPLTQVVELPGVVKTAVQGSCVIQSLYNEGLIASEYKDTKPLFLFTHGPGMLHTKDKKVEKPEDLANLRIRRPTSVVASFLEKVKALPVGMPAPDSYQSLQRGVIDGVALPWEGATVFKINELANNHTDIGGLYSLAFIVTMNKDVYNRLDPQLKAVIDKNSGMSWSLKSGKSFDALDGKGMAEAKKMGDNIYTVSDSDMQSEWKPVLDSVTQDYLDALEAKGLPAKAVYKRAMELSSGSCANPA
ncbi:TRAP transporter substrate-binding protein [Vibrio fluvialis]